MTWVNCGAAGDESLAREALAPGGLAPGRMPWDVAEVPAQVPAGWRYLDPVPAALQPPRSRLTGGVAAAPWRRGT